MAGDKKISELDSASTLTGNEQTELVQVGNNVRATLNAIKNWIATTLSFIKIVLTPQSTPPTYAEGTIYYDDNKKAFTGYNDQSDVSLNFGEEIIAPIVINNTGSQIDNGTPVYLSGVSGGYYTIDLADSGAKEKCRKVYVATQDIANGATGRVTKIGEIGGLNLSAYSIGDILYLDSPSGLTTTMPDDGQYLTQIGLVKSNSGTDDILYVDVKTSDITVEVTDTNGFPSDQRTGTTISFVDGTRTFTIAPTGSDFHYYQLGNKYEKTSSEDVIITDVSGNHLIYYDEGTLTAAANPSLGLVDQIIRTKCLVAYVYWNSTEAKHIALNDERHGISMAPDTHAYLHFTRGIQYLDGLAIDNIVIGNGSSNTHAQFGTASGSITDEDLFTLLDAVVSTTGLTYYYRDGASGIYNSGTNAGYSFPVGSTPLPQYNEYTGATYQLTEITSGNYMLLHIFGTNSTDEVPICVLGNTEYSTISAATIGAETEIGEVLGDVPTPEFLPIATAIIEGKTSFTNTPQARLVQDTNGNDYIDWRTSELQPGASPTSHTNLSNLDSDDHAQYLNINGRAGGQTAYGGTASGDDLTLESTSSGTKGYVLMQPNGGNTGIGIAVPEERLHVYDATQNVISIFESGDEGVYIALKDNTTSANGVLVGAIGDDLILRGGGINTIWVNDQKVGINEDSPLFSLDVNGTGRFTDKLQIDTTDAGSFTQDYLVLDGSNQIEKVTQLKQTSEASNATPAPTGDARENEHYITAQAAAATFTNPSGTAANGNNLMIRIKDDGTARALTWGTDYDAFYDTLPSTTIAGKYMYINFIYNSTSTKFEMVSIVNEA